MAKLNIGERNALASATEVSSFSFFFIVVSSDPLAAGLLGSKKPVGFLKEVINSIFRIASSAVKSPGASPARGSSERPTAIAFILSISTP